MSHKKKAVARIKKGIRAQHLDLAEIRALLIFLEALLKSSGGRMSRSRKTGKKHGTKKSTRHLRPGIHMVRVGRMMRKVRVLSNGKWRFMKG